MQNNIELPFDKDLLDLYPEHRILPGLGLFTMTAWELKNKRLLLLIRSLAIVRLSAWRLAAAVARGEKAHNAASGASSEQQIFKIAKLIVMKCIIWFM